MSPYRDPIEAVKAARKVQYSSLGEARREPGNQDQTGLSPSLTRQASEEKGEDNNLAARALGGQVEVVDVAAPRISHATKSLPSGQAVSTRQVQTRIRNDTRSYCQPYQPGQQESVVFGRQQQNKTVGATH